MFSCFENANNIIDYKIKNEMNVHDKVRIMFNHPSFDNPIKFLFILKRDLKIDYILGKFLQQVHSYRENNISVRYQEYRPRRIQSILKLSHFRK